jgi:hypothetical protein
MSNLYNILPIGSAAHVYLFFSPKSGDMVFKFQELYRLHFDISKSLFLHPLYLQIQAVKSINSLTHACLNI